MEIPIVFEDDILLVVDKPSGVIVNKADSVKVETIQDWAEEKLKTPSDFAQGKQNFLRKTDQPLAEKFNTEYENDFYQRAGIVHRLDKETSGLLIIAKTPPAFFHLQNQFKERLITKRYKTLVHGSVKPPEGEIRASVGRLPWNRERFGILAGGREAITSYKVLDYFKHPEFISGSNEMLKQVQHNRRAVLRETYSLLDVYPHTGRTHQIRIHLKYIGHAVVADSFYAGRKTYRQDIKFCPRLFLHAAYIKFSHPKTGKIIELESNLPEDLQKVIACMTQNV